MKIEFPLWIVLDPTPASGIGDIVWKVDDAAQFVRVIAGGSDISGRNVTLHTDAGSAAVDAKQRLAIRPLPEIEWIQVGPLAWVARHNGHNYRMSVGSVGYRVEIIGHAGATIRVLEENAPSHAAVDLVVATDGMR